MFLTPNDETSDVDLTELLESQEFKDELVQFAQEQRERLDQRYPWWADVVFMARDMKGMCTLLDVTGKPDIARIIAGIMGKSISHLLTVLEPNKPLDELITQLENDADELDALTLKRFGSKFGAQQLEH